jgi:exopolyphosphatase/guanosine-5'-triphosphate,3'-diphosphate pyrophosphatase
VRTVTVEQFQARWRIDREHAARVAAMAVALYRRAVKAPDPTATRDLEWAALLHETGFSVSHTGFHKHGAYIVQNADMPGFSAGEQQTLATLILGCRGGLSKMAGALADAGLRAQLLALRLAVLFHHARRPIAAPRIALTTGGRIRFGVSPRWLKGHPLTAHLLAKERAEWTALGYPWTVG